MHKSASRPTDSWSFLLAKQTLAGAWSTGVSRGFRLTTHMVGASIISLNLVALRDSSESILWSESFLYPCILTILLTSVRAILDDDFFFWWQAEYVKVCNLGNLAIASAQLSATGPGMLWVQFYVFIPSEEILVYATWGWKLWMGQSWEHYGLQGHIVVLALLCSWAYVSTGAAVFGAIRGYASLALLLWQHCLCYPNAHPGNFLLWHPKAIHCKLLDQLFFSYANWPAGF